MRRCWSGGMPSLSCKKRIYNVISFHSDLLRTCCSPRRPRCCPALGLLSAIVGTDLDFGLDVLDRVRGLDLEGDRLASQGFYKDLHGGWLTRPRRGRERALLCAGWVVTVAMGWGFPNPQLGLSAALLKGRPASRGYPFSDA
eukprot:361631-Chlamydomonas_euryale.AAC.2